METTTPPPIVPPAPPTDQRVRIGPILRDVVIIVMLTFIGGFVIGLAGTPPTSSRGMLAIAASNLLLGTIGFAISGCLAVGNRWRHLGYIALGVWLAGLLNVMFFGFSVAEWFFSVIAVAMMMGIGGAISYLFKKGANSQE
jgi:hypothetical protein